MSRHRGFTLAELLVVVLGIVVFVAVFWPAHSCHGPSEKVACGTNIRSVWQAMMTYAIDNADAFPIAGKSDPTTYATGFAAMLWGRESVMPDDPLMVNNVTASLWMLVREDWVTPKSFICPSSGDQKDELYDATGGKLLLKQTWDFSEAKNLSYSPINMYHESAKAKWSSNATSEDVVLGDNNNADGPGVHELSKGADAAAVAKLENSANHYGEGQSFGFADGHVQFSYNPFVGVKDDNVYARNVDGKNVAPSMSSAAGDAVLLPITGNNGVSLSGLPGPGHRVPPATYDWVWPIAGVIGVIGLAVVICLIADGVGRLVRGGKARANER